MSYFTRDKFVNYRLIDYFTVHKLQLLLYLSVIGIVSNAFFSVDHFYKLYVPILLILYSSIVYQSKYVKSINTLIDAFTNNSSELRIFCKNHFDRKLYTKPIPIVVFIASIIIALIFILSIYFVTDIEFNLTFIVGCIALIMSTLFSITSYYYYFINIILLYKFSKQSIKISDLEVPQTHLTSWFINLIDMTRALNNGFILIGLLYSIQYFAVCYVGNSLFSNLIKSMSNVFFFISWIIIMIMIVLVFIIGCFFQKKLIKKIFFNINQSVIYKLNNEYKNEFNKIISGSEIKAEALLAVDTAITRFEKPVSNPALQLNSFGNFILTLLTVTVNMSSLYVNHFK